MSNTDRHNTGGNSADDFTTLSPAEQEYFLALVSMFLFPRQTINRRHTSYGLKHCFEVLMPGGYISNGQMKGAMLRCGFLAADEWHINWSFNISEQSPILQYAKGSSGRGLRHLERQLDRLTLAAKNMKE